MPQPLVPPGWVLAPSDDGAELPDFYVPAHWLVLDEGPIQIDFNRDRPPTSIEFDDHDGFTLLGLPYVWGLDPTRWRYDVAPPLPVPIPAPPITPGVPPVAPFPIWIGGLIGIGTATAVNTLQNATDAISAAIGIINTLGGILSELEGLRDRLNSAIGTLMGLINYMNCSTLPSPAKEICEKCLKKIKDLLQRMWGLDGKLTSLIDNIKYMINTIKDSIWAGTIGNLIGNFSNCVAVANRERDRIKGLWAEMLKAWGDMLAVTKDCFTFFGTPTPPGNLPGGIIPVSLDHRKVEHGTLEDPATSPFFDISRYTIRNPPFMLPDAPVFDNNADCLHIAPGLGFTIDDARADAAALAAAWPTNMP
jgi:hypothetical protein